MEGFKKNQYSAHLIGGGFSPVGETSVLTTECNREFPFYEADRKGENSLYQGYWPSLEVFWRESHLIQGRRGWGRRECSRQGSQLQQGRKVSKNWKEFGLAVRVVHEDQRVWKLPGESGRHNHTDFIPRALGSIWRILQKGVACSVLWFRKSVMTA